MPWVTSGGWHTTSPATWCRCAGSSVVLTASICWPAPRPPSTNSAVRSGMDGIGSTSQWDPSHVLRSPLPNRRPGLGRP